MIKRDRLRSLEDIQIPEMKNQQQDIMEDLLLHYSHSYASFHKHQVYLEALDLMFDTFMGPAKDLTTSLLNGSEDQSVLRQQGFNLAILTIVQNFS